MQATANGASWPHRFLGIMRIVFGLLFLQTVMAKLLGWPHAPSFDNMHAFDLAWYAGVIELIGGALLAIGLFTRPVAFILSGEMAVAYFLRHEPRSFFPIVNGGTAAILYCFIYFYFFLVGSGAYGIDNARR